MTTTHSDGFTETLSLWCAETPRIEGPDALRLASEAIKDTLGCMVAGSDDEITRSVRSTALRMGKGEASVVGGGARLSESGAALVNGTAAHIYDYDDNFFPAAAMRARCWCRPFSRLVKPWNVTARDCWMPMSLGWRRWGA